MLQKYKGYDGITDKIVFEIDTINICNFNCPYCEMQNNKWNPNNDRTDWGKTQDILSLIPFFKNFPYSYRIHLLGGEPTMHKDLKEFIKALPDADIKLFTNGSNVSTLLELSDLPNPPSLTISIHPNEYDKDYLEVFLEYGLYEKFKNLKFLGILYKLDKNYDYFVKLFNRIQAIPNTSIDMYLPFDENGNYKATKMEFDLWEKLSKLFLIDYIKIDDNYIDHRMVYERNFIDSKYLRLTNNKTCYKNLWLVDYKSTFHKDGTDINYTLEEAMKDYSLFKFKTVSCDKPCWCPANNYYTKIRH